jgi:hypothetical protein
MHPHLDLIQQTRRRFLSTTSNGLGALACAALYQGSVGMAHADPGTFTNYNCLKSIDQWKPLAGKFSILNGVLRPTQLEDGCGMLLFRDPEMRWPNSAHITARITKCADQSNFSFLFNYIDQENYFLCEFGLDRKAGRIDVKFKSVINDSTEAEMRHFVSFDFDVPVDLACQFRRDSKSGCCIWAVAAGQTLPELTCKSKHREGFGLSVESMDVGLDTLTVSEIMNF